ncbi:hypothetical protein TELCIR_13573, partial [Teladorsagia circumcincta]
PKKKKFYSKRRLQILHKGSRSIRSKRNDARVTNLKLNNSLVTVIEGNIADIIRGMANYAAKGFTIDGNIVKYETKGTCVFRYGVEQKVKINETALRSYYK